MKRAPAGPRRGFTLVEVLAAFVLIAIILPAVAKGISVCVKAEDQARKIVEVAALADSKMSELMAYTSWQGESVSGDFGPDYPDYRWTAASLTFMDTLEEVVLIITWPEVGVERSWTLSTLVYRSSSTSTSSTGTSG